jgi:O-antigen ligase
MNHLRNFSFSGIAVIFLSFFIIFNPSTNLDILSFLLIAFLILQKIFGEYFILILLAFRPALDYWRDYNIFSSRLFYFNINAALSLFLFIWSIIFFVRNYAYFKKIPLKIIWLIFIAWCALSATFTYNLFSTFVETLKLSNLFALFGICYIMSEKNKDKFQHNFLKSLMVGAVVPITMGAYQLITKTGLTIDEISNRIYGTFAHPNVLATFALLLLIVLVNEFINTNKEDLKKLNLLKFFAVILLATIAFTYTRIAWIGAAFLFVSIGLIYYRTLLLYILGIIILFYAAFYPINRYLIKNYNVHLQNSGIINRLTNRNPDSDSINWRADVITKVIPLFRKKYLIGYGYGTFPKVWDDNKDVSNIWDNTSEAHNDYIKIAVESGILGLILFLIIFASLLYKQIIIAFKTHFKNIVFLTSILIYLILSLSDNMLHHTPVIWWFWAVWGLWEQRMKKNKIGNLNS